MSDSDDVLGKSLHSLYDNKHEYDSDDEDQSCLDSKGESNFVQYGPPIDRGWAWVTVLGCFGVITLVVGSLKSFGVLLVDLSKRLDAPTSLIVSTQSLAGFLHLALAPLANALSVRFSHRTIVFIGGLFTSIGLIATAFVSSVEWLFVTYGLIAGIGFGLTVSPSLVYMGSHFQNRRSLANGLSASGSGAGALALPNLMIFLMQEYGFTGSLLLVGGVVLNTCTFSCLFRPHSFWKRKTEKSPIDQNGNVKERDTSKEFKARLISKLTGGHSLRLSTGCLISRHKNDNIDKTLFGSQPNMNFERLDKSEQTVYGYSIGKSRYHSNRNVGASPFLYTSMESLSTMPVQQKLKSSIAMEETKLKSKYISCAALLDWSLLKSPVFIMYNTALWTGIFGHHTVFNCLPSLADEFGMSDSDGAFVISIVGLSDFIGRITSGWFSDLKILQRKTVFQISLGIFTICLFIIPHTTSFVGLCIMSAITGLSTGGYAGIQLAVLADAFGVENLSSTLGFVSIFASLSLLGCPLLAGLSRDIAGTWTNAFRLGASVTAFGVLLLFLEPLALKLSSKPLPDKEELEIVIN